VHWATVPGDVADLDLPDSPRVDDVLVGAGFKRAGKRRARRLRTLPDTVAPGMRLLVCGLNPSLVAADAGFGFAGATNRFWPAALQAGLVTQVRDPLHALLVDGVGMTDLVKRATKGSADLSADEYRVGADRVECLVRWLHPTTVLFVGLEGWRAAVDRRAQPGVQPSTFGGAPAYVMPSTSGLNAHARLADLVAHMRAAGGR
jgi:TDG/mug DNA glycosylase family protein